MSTHTYLELHYPALSVTECIMKLCKLHALLIHYFANPHQYSA